MNVKSAKSELKWEDIGGGMAEAPSAPAKNDNASSASSARGGEDISLSDLLPWLTSLGAGMLGHSTVSPFFDDEDKKRKSAWYRLLGTLVPLGVGGAAAYGGYRLGELLKKGQDNASGRPGPFATFNRGGSQGQEYISPDKRQNVVDLVNWGRDHTKGSDEPLEDIAKSKARTDTRWAIGQGVGSAAAGAAALYQAGKAYRDFTLDGLFGPTQAQMDAANEVLGRVGKGLTTQEAARLAELNSALETGTPIPSDVSAAQKLQSTAQTSLGDIEKEIFDLQQRGQLSKTDAAHLKALQSEKVRIMRDIATHRNNEVAISPERMSDYRAQQKELHGRSSIKEPTPAEVAAAKAVRNGKGWNWKSWLGGMKPVLKNVRNAAGLGAVSAYLGSRALSNGADAADAYDLAGKIVRDRERARSQGYPVGSGVK